MTLDELLKLKQEDYEAFLVYSKNANTSLDPNKLKDGYVNQVQSGKEGGFKRKGKSLTDEARKKISEKNLGRKVPYIKRKEFSEEHRKKLGEAGKGRTHSEESKRKIKEAKSFPYAVYEGVTYTREQLNDKLGYSQKAKTLLKIKKGRIKDKWGITFL
jgi:hypothetical protein